MAHHVAAPAEGDLATPAVGEHTPGLERVAPRALAVGEVLAERFEVVRSLGAGGFGQVYAARDLALGQDVAVKVLHPQGSSAQVVRARLYAELLASRQITSTSVCRTFDVFAHASSPGVWGQAQPTLWFLVMELVSGGSLAAALREGWRPEDPLAALAALAAIADGLAAVHGAGLTHGDLKPGNILLEDGTGRLVLADFGLARTPQHPTAADKRGGTAPYAAPEVLAGEPGDPRADCYSWGVLACELLDPEVFASEGPRRSRRLAGSVAQLIERCLDPDPLARPEDARVLAATLLHVTRSRRRAPLLIGSLLAALLLAWSVGAIERWQAREEAARAEARGTWGETIAALEQLDLEDPATAHRYAYALARAGRLGQARGVVANMPPSADRDVAHAEVLRATGAARDLTDAAEAARDRNCGTSRDERLCHRASWLLALGRVREGQRLDKLAARSDLVFTGEDRTWLVDLLLDLALLGAGLEPLGTVPAVLLEEARRGSASERRLLATALVWRRSRFDCSLSPSEDQLALDLRTALEIGSPRARAELLRGFLVSASVGCLDIEPARELSLAEEAVVAARASGDDLLLGVALQNAAAAHENVEGNVFRAIALQKEGVALLGQHGALRMRAYILASLAGLSLDSGDPAGARQSFAAALEAARTYEDRNLEVAVELGFGALATLTGDGVEADSAFERARERAGDDDRLLASAERERDWFRGGTRPEDCRKIDLKVPRNPNTQAALRALSHAAVALRCGDPVAGEQVLASVPADALAAGVPSWRRGLTAAGLLAHRDLAGAEVALRQLALAASRSGRINSGITARAMLAQVVAQRGQASLAAVLQAEVDAEANVAGLPGAQTLLAPSATPSLGPAAVPMPGVG